MGTKILILPPPLRGGGKTPPPGGGGLEILEYCLQSELLEREQYYLDLLVPEYNILKTAYSLFPLPPGGGEGDRLQT